MITTNPERDFAQTPGEFSDISRIIDVELEDRREGIILDSPEEFAQALIVYDGMSVEGERATQNDLIDEVGVQGCGMGAGLLLLVRERNAKGFTERLAQEALSELQSGRRFHRRFEYDAKGTNFVQTSIFGRKEGDKYLLHFYTTYAGSEPERKLAETLGKPMALVSSDVKGRLSVVDEWWYNVNFEKVLEGLPISKEQLRDIPESIASAGFARNYPEITFNHEGQLFALDIDIKAISYLRPEGKGHGSEYMQARGDNIVGGAWISRANDERITPRVIQPSIVVSVSFPINTYSHPVAVTEDQMKAMQEARDSLAEIFTRNNL